MVMLPQVETHYREATALFQRRGRLLNAPASPLDALRQLDWRLAANLDAVAIHQEGHPEASLRPPALFVETWVGLQRDSVHCLENLDEIFPKLKPEQQGAVIQAMTLSSCSGEVRHPELRAALMSEQTAMAMSEEEAAEQEVRAREIVKEEQLEAAEIGRRESTEKKRVATELSLEKDRISSQKTREVIEIDRKRSVEEAEQSRVVALADKKTERAAADAAVQQAEIFAKRDVEAMLTSVAAKLRR